MIINASEGGRICSNVCNALVTFFSASDSDLDRLRASLKS